MSHDLIREARDEAQKAEKAHSSAQHGTRAMYARGCRCLPCRAANAADAATRAERSAGALLVSAEAARKHLQALQQKRVGHHQASVLSGLSWTFLYGVRSGRRRHIRARTEARILAIPAQPADGARINSYATRHLLRCLLGEGFTHREIQRRTGLYTARHGLTSTPSRARSITVRTARSVQRFFDFITAE